MASLVPRAASLTVGRLLPAVMLAAAAMLVGSTIGEPGTASAKPKEWDIEKYDACMEAVKTGYMAGEWTTDEMGYMVSSCCLNSGGVESGGNCSAPPAVAASDTPSATPSENANPDVPAAPPPTKTTTKPPTPRSTFTLAPIVPPVG